MNDSLKLSNEALLKKKKDALAGSPQAGYDLVEYYSGYAHDDKQIMYWAQIAAENGDAKGAKNAFNYANFLSFEKGDIMSLIRARFWVSRSIGKGDALDKQLLSDIDEKISDLEVKASK